MSSEFIEPSMELEPSTTRGLSKVQAVIVFRNATRTTLTYAKRAVEVNLGDRLLYDPHSVGQLIYAYWIKRTKG